MSFHKNIDHCLYTPKGSPRRSNGVLKNLPEAPHQNDDPAKGSSHVNTEKFLPAGTLATGISMGKGMVLQVSSIPYAFTLPHRYHERLEYALSNNHPDSQILLNRRVGYLGAASPVRYSILAYLEKSTDVEVKVAGAALNNTEAWSYNTLILLKDLGIGIAKTLEHIAALPIHTPLDFKGQAPAHTNSRHSRYD